MSEENAKDCEDLKNARHKTPHSKKSLWKCFGPGLITGVADDDPSGIGTYSVAGAQFGYGMLWLTPVCIPLMIAVQEMSGRIGRVCGNGLAAVIKKHYPKWLLYTVIMLLIGANLFNIYADLNIMAASAQMLFGISFNFWLTIITVGMVLAQILIPYCRYVNLLKWLSLSLLAYVITAFLPTVHNDWVRIGHALVIPSWQWDPKYIMTLVGYLGTTITPYLFFWQAGEEVEEQIAEGKADAPGKRTEPVTQEEIRYLRTDTCIGMSLSQIVTFFILICTAATLHANGITEINTAQDAAKALLPLGKAAYWLFTLGILGTGLIAIPTLSGSTAYALSETFDWPYGLYRRFSRAKAFYCTIAIMTALGYALNFVSTLSPIKALLYSAVLNGVVTFPLLIVLMLICNNKNIIQDRINGWTANIFGTLAVLLMGGSVIFMLWSMSKSFRESLGIS